MNATIFSYPVLDAIGWLCDAVADGFDALRAACRGRSVPAPVAVVRPPVSAGLVAVARVSPFVGWPAVPMVVSLSGAPDGCEFYSLPEFAEFFGLRDAERMLRVACEDGYISDAECARALRGVRLFFRLRCSASLRLSSVADGCLPPPWRAI